MRSQYQEKIAWQYYRCYSKQFVHDRFRLQADEKYKLLAYVCIAATKRFHLYQEFHNEPDNRRF